MKILKLNPENPDINLVNKAIEVMANGGVVLYPTDTVYGLGANIFNKDAVKKIYKIKQRDFNKPLSVLVSDTYSLDLIAELNEKQWAMVNGWLPGPYTFILHKKPIVPPFVSHSYKIGIRIPDNKIARYLARIFPITTTSANLSNQDTLANPKDILNQIGNSVDLVIDVGSLKSDKPSTVIDLTKSKPFLLRKGFGLK